MASGTFRIHYCDTKSKLGVRSNFYPVKYLSFMKENVFLFLSFFLKKIFIVVKFKT